VSLGYALLLFLGVWVLRRRWPFAGAGSLLYALLYFAGQFFLEFTRGDEAIYLGSLRLAQVLDLALALAAAGALLALWWRWRAGPEEREDVPKEEGDAGESREAEDALLEKGGSGDTEDAPEPPDVEVSDQDPDAEPPEVNIIEE
jgi:membrane protein implicated in regulation of membrane protease activity